MTGDLVVVVAPGTGDETMRTVVLRSARLGASATLARSGLDQEMVHRTWLALREDIEARMRKAGYVPIEAAHTELVEDVDTVTCRMEQLVRESEDPTWISVRQAVAEDQADLAKMRRGR